jgi:magnesium chelatase subunit I
MDRARTVGELRASGYRIRSVKDEMRNNLIRKLRTGEPLFPGIVGYDETVIPQVQNAILARHDTLLLGLRGQAKTRMLRMLVHLLDDTIPVVAGSEVNDNPFAPISKHARDRLDVEGDRCPIEWIGRDRRYCEKLATPDVTIADLIGEIDMIKHAEGRYLSSELTMHFGLIPRTHRGIFCMNELPDLSPKIQVGLFNVLEERDVQIRGYPVRLELDLCMVFSANPEDYTNRGRIVTPLKDRIGSVIKTHYPLTREIGIRITDENAWLDRDGGVAVVVPYFMKEILEESVRLARRSSHINQSSGVSVRMSIANCENLVSNAERRAIATGEMPAVPRISDLSFIVASSRGKIELTMSEDDGQEDKVVDRLVAEAVKNVFAQYCDAGRFRAAIDAFEGGRTFEVGDLVPSNEYVARIEQVPGLKKPLLECARTLTPDLLDTAAQPAALASIAEFVLEGLHVHNKLNKHEKGGKLTYRR